MIPRPTVWSALPDPPPAPRSLSVSAAAVPAAVDVLPVGPLRELGEDAGRPAAVLVALADGPDGRAGVLLTRRSRQLRSHSGEISFPGGRIDPGETPVAAALREAHEEVGLEPDLVSVVGGLDHLAATVSRNYIVPVVGVLERQIALVPTSMEVERVMWVPLAELVRPDTYRVERWGQPPNCRTLYFFELDDETVWGATAFVLRELLQRLAAGLPDPASPGPPTTT